MLDDVLAAQAGDPRAYGRLVGRFSGFAVGYATALLGDRHAAEDVAQEAFLAALADLPQLKDPRAFPGWFKRVVFKHCDRWRRRHRSEPLGSPLPAVSPEEQLAETRARSALRAAVEALPEHERLAVALHYFGDLPQEEVAALLELPLSTVKKRLHTARRRLEARGRPMLLGEHTPRAHLAPLEERIRLFVALRAQDTPVVAAILDRHPDWVDLPEGWSDAQALRHGLHLAHHLTPLILAARRGDLELVELLLDRGARVDGPCGCANHETALFTAAVHGHQAVVHRLLAAGADPNAPHRVGLTPLHVAHLRDDQASIAALLAAGADPERRAANGRRPADWPPPERPREPIEATTIPTGIKAIDLLAPLAPGMLVRVQGAAETGLMVLLAELTYRLATRGLPSLWVTWEPQPWQRHELRELAARSGLMSVEVVSAGLGAVQLPTPRALFVFRREGHETEVDQTVAELRGAAPLVVVVDPWLPVTRGERPPVQLSPPFDAVWVTDPALARANIYPALDLERTRSRRPLQPAHAELLDRLRARRSDPAVQRLLAQPFFVVSHDTGCPGRELTLAESLAEAQAIVGSG